MNRSLLITATVATMAFGSAAANAASIYMIDNFNTAAGDPFTTSLNRAVGSSTPYSDIRYEQGPVSYTIGGNVITRSINFALTEDTSNAPQQVAKLTVGPTVLAIANGSATNSTLSLSYGISSLSSQILTAGAGNSTTKFTVTFSDGIGNANAGVNPASINAYLDNQTLGTVSLGQIVNSGTGPRQISFTLLNGLIDGTDTLRFSFAGPTGYDLTISAIALVVSPPSADVPEPAMIGILGFGLVGLGFARRRKR